MKLKFILITLLLLGLKFPLFAQTKEIAWKSHSGSSAHFNPNGTGDLGLDTPEPVLVRIEKVNDTTFLKTYEPFNGKTYDETTYNDVFWMRPNIALDSLRVAYYPNVKMVGFEPKDDSKILKKSKKVGKHSKKNK